MSHFLITSAVVPSKLRCPPGTNSQSGPPPFAKCESSSACDGNRLHADRTPMANAPSNDNLRNCAHKRLTRPFITLASFASGMDSLPQPTASREWPLTCQLFMSATDRSWPGAPGCRMITWCPKPAVAELTSVSALHQCGDATNVLRKKVNASALICTCTSARFTPGGSLQISGASLVSCGEHGARNT